MDHIVSITIVGDKGDEKMMEVDWFLVLNDRELHCVEMRKL
jgi:hypothetical protein